MHDLLCHTCALGHCVGFSECQHPVCTCIVDYFTKRSSKKYFPFKIVLHNRTNTSIVLINMWLCITFKQKMLFCIILTYNVVKKVSIILYEWKTYLKMLCMERYLKWFKIVMAKYQYSVNNVFIEASKIHEFHIAFIHYRWKNLDSHCQIRKPWFELHVFARRNPSKYLTTIYRRTITSQCRLWRQQYDSQILLNYDNDLKYV